MKLVLILMMALICHIAEAKTHRSTAAKNAFKKLHPCPSTGLPKGNCLGWVIDHIKPLCAGGADAPSNMQWQSVADAKVKDREEKRICRNKL